MSADDRILELEAKVAELEIKLNFDEMTGCYSRQYLYGHFAENVPENCRLIFVDLDDFKSVNDHYGHRAGDELLILIAQAMIVAVGEAGFVVRVAGDEFIIVIYQISNLAFLDLEAAIRAKISDVKLSVDGLEVSRNASFGFIALTPEMGVRKAVALADAALMNAKSAGKNRSQGIERNPSKQAPLKPSIDEVRLALKKEEIGYYVQPIINCLDLSVDGYEALIRWCRPSGIVMGPDQFLDTLTKAYDTKTRPPLAAARATSEWAAETQGKFISFNISEAFIERVSREGLEWVVDLVGDVPNDQIVFELLETMVERQSSLVHKAVTKLRSMGIRVALDDFGIGHSNLMRLQGLDVDIVKIDKRFIHGAVESDRGRDLLEGMVGLIHNLNVQTVIEGVETAEHLKIAQDIGASLAQGYFLGRPKPTREV